MLQVLTAGGDGKLRLWDFMHPQPLIQYAEHQGEVFSCDWNHINKRQFLSASYDRSIKLWDVDSFASIATYMHAFVAYSAQWHPTQ